MFQISGVLLLNAKSFFYDGIEPKIGFEEYGLSLEIEIYLQWPNQSSYRLYLSADEDQLSKIELHLGLYFLCQ